MSDATIAAPVVSPPPRSILDLSSAIVHLPPPDSVASLIARNGLAPHAERGACDRAAFALPTHLAEHFGKLFDKPISNANVFLTLGVRDGLARLIDTQSRLQNGIITLTPCYPGYAEVFRNKNIPIHSEALFECFERSKREVHQLPIRALEKKLALTAKKTRYGAVIATAPNTPTNSFPDRSELRNLSKLCATQARLLIVDNTFDTFDLTMPWNPYPMDLDSTILTGSISEAYSLSQLGLHIGYVIGPKPIIAELRHEARTNRERVGPTPHATLCAFLSMFDSEGYLERRNDELRFRHALADRLAELPNVTSVSGQAGTTKWLRFSSTQMADEARTKLAQSEIQIKAGGDYGVPNANRISLVTQRDRSDFNAAMSKVLAALR